MVKYDTVLIRYGELSTKGKNRKDFITRLFHNVKYALRDYPDLTYQKTHDRIYIKLTDEDTDEISAKLKRVFGISSFSFTEKVESNIEEIKKTCLRIASESNKKTFKMMTKRHDKSFAMISDEINRACAGEILHNTGLTVDVHNPELLIRVEVHEKYTYITSDKIKGAGGYPAGINGKVLLLLSGGIDSPVAAYELMKRGLFVEAIHFASPPYTSEAARNKVLKLAEMMSEYQGSMRVHVINFTDIQLNIYKTAGDPYAVTIITGESVGQVASQTLESIAVINETITMPVLRPLVCFDKVEIIDLARQIGTYETSILPFEDCCTIFDPKNPVTHPTSEKSVHYETMFDYETLLNEAIEKQEVISVYPRKEEEEFL